MKKNTSVKKLHNNLTYTNEDALRDGVIIKILPKTWEQLGDKQIYISKTLADYISINRISNQRLIDMWNNFMEWKKETQPYLPAERDNFTYSLHGKKVQAVLGDVTLSLGSEPVTFLFPED